MKEKFFGFSVFFIFLFSVNLYAQSGVIEARPKAGNINFNDVFSKVFNKTNVNGCIISVTFAKFTIDTVGNVGKITFLEDKASPAFIQKLLTEVILSSNGSWIPCTINGKKVESKPFILPLIYQLEAGCNGRRAEDKTGDTLLRILALNNGSGENNQLNCIILQPLNLFSQR